MPGPSTFAGPNTFAPPAFARGVGWQPKPVVPAPVFPSYTGAGAPGTPLAYSTNAVQTTVVQDSGQTLSVASITGFPNVFPYTLLMEWGTTLQEVVTVTSPPTGNGPYTFTGVLRGQDQTTQVTHAPGSQVNHGVSARDFFSNPPTFNVMAYGADPTGALDSTAAVQAAFSAAVAAGYGVVTYPAGKFKQSAPAGGDVGASVVYVVGEGTGATTIMYQGTGDCWRMYSSVYSTPNSGGGGFLGITIDGTNSVGVANGFHMGDIFRFRVDVVAQNFTKSGSVGLWFDNQFYWTEQLQGYAFASNCATNVCFDNAPGGATATATGSFMRTDLVIGINQGAPTFDGLVFRNGAFCANGRIHYRGNFGGSASALASAALRLTGSTPTGPLGYTSGVTASVINDSFLDIGVENAAGANNPQTINFGSGSNSMNNNIGILNFGAAGAFAASNNAGNINNMVGVVTGDSSLTSALGFGTNLALTGGINLGNYNGAQTLTNGSTISLSNNGGSYTRVTSAANVTGIVMPAQFAGSNYDGQIVYILNVGTFSVTFAAAGTSLVADGASDVIAAGTCRAFIYDYMNNLWRHVV